MFFKLFLLVITLSLITTLIFIFDSKLKRLLFNNSISKEDNILNSNIGQIEGKQATKEIEEVLKINDYKIDSFLTNLEKAVFAKNLNRI
jgi:hypothetical protein